MDWIFARGRLVPALLLTVAALVGAAAVTTYEACAVYTPSLLQDDGGKLPLDASTDLDAGCVPATPPTRPATASDPDAADLNETIIVAMKSIDIGLEPDGGPFGYDLDTVCTCVDNGPQSCSQPPNDKSCDDDAGRDNYVIKLFQLLDEVGGGKIATTGTEKINEGLQAGEFSLLIAVRGYNGQPNDPQVNVAVYVSNGLDDVQDGGTAKPLFNGGDEWTIDPSSLTNGQEQLGKSCDNDSPYATMLRCQPAVEDDTAYVSNYVLVANPSGKLPVVFGDRSFLGGASMQLTEGILVGTLSPTSLSTGSSFSLTQGTIAGRWATADLLSTLAYVPVADGGFLCGSSNTSYQAIKQVVCAVADITTSSLTDNTAPLTPCNAVSVGMTFSAAPALLGDVYGVPAPEAGCATSAGPFMDDCTF